MPCAGSPDGLAPWPPVRLALALASAARAQPSPSRLSTTWPEKTVRFIIPLPPGSGTDLAGRLVAERLSERWGQPVVVENRQGADGIPAVSSFLSARDNHTFLLFRRRDHLQCTPARAPALRPGHRSGADRTGDR